MSKRLAISTQRLRKRYTFRLNNPYVGENDNLRGSIFQRGALP